MDIITLAMAKKYTDQILEDISGSNATALASLADQVAAVREIAQGRNKGYVFDTKEALMAWLADSSNVSKLKIGDNLYIKAKDVPDYWWDGSQALELETEKVSLEGYLTTNVADATYQPKGNYLTTSDAANTYQLQGDYLTTQDAADIYQIQGNYLTTDDAANTYQIKGSYLTINDAVATYQPKGDYLTTEVAANVYQIQGDYLTTEDAADTYQLKGSYLTTTDAADTYQLKGSYLTTEVATATYQPKGSYLTSHQDISGKQNVLTAGNNVDITNDVISVDLSNYVTQAQFSNYTFNAVDIVDRLNALLDASRIYIYDLTNRAIINNNDTIDTYKVQLMNYQGVIDINIGNIPFHVRWISYNPEILKIPQNYDAEPLLIRHTAEQQTLVIKAYLVATVGNTEYLSSNCIEYNLTVNSSSYRIMSVKIDQTNSNPETCCTYADDAVDMAPGHDLWDAWFGYYPCVLENGMEIGRLNPNNYKEWENGSPCTLGDNQDVMIACPIMGVHIETDENDVITVSMTDAPDAGEFSYWAHYNGKEFKDRFYIGAYKAYYNGTQLYSIPGYEATVNTNLTDFRTRARARGQGYNLRSYYQLIFWQVQYLLKYRNLNSQSAVGQGYSGGAQTDVLYTGETDDKGLNYGTSNSTVRAKCLGLEDPWGNINEWIDGIHIDSAYNLRVARDPSKFSSSIGAAGYEEYPLGISSNLDGYPTRVLGTTDGGFVMTQKGASSTTYFCDYANSYAGCFAYFGGHRSQSAYCGAFYLRVDCGAASAHWNLGARLAYIDPTTTETE